MSNFTPGNNITAAKLNNVGTDLQTLVTSVERNQIQEGGLDGSSFVKGSSSPWLGPAPVIDKQVGTAQTLTADGLVNFRTHGTDVDVTSSLALLDLHDYYLVEATGRIDALHFLDQLNLDGADIPAGLSVFTSYCSTLELQYSEDGFATAGTTVGIPWQVNSLVASGVHAAGNEVTEDVLGTGDKKPASLYATYSQAGGVFPDMMGPGYSRHFHLSALVPRLTFPGATSLSFGLYVDICVGTGTAENTTTNGAIQSANVRLLDTVIRISTLRG